MKLTGENRQLGEKPVPVPLCPPQISHGLSRDRTRACRRVFLASVRTFSKHVVGDYRLHTFDFLMRLQEGLLSVAI
jgi:hypothetical protein